MTVSTDHEDDLSKARNATETRRMARILEIGENIAIFCNDASAQFENVTEDFKQLKELDADPAEVLRIIFNSFSPELAKKIDNLASGRLPPDLIRAGIEQIFTVAMRGGDVTAATQAVGNVFLNPGAVMPGAEEFEEPEPSEGGLAWGPFLDDAFQNAPIMQGATDPQVPAIECQVILASGIDLGMGALSPHPEYYRARLMRFLVIGQGPNGKPMGRETVFDRRDIMALHFPKPIPESAPTKSRFSL